MAYASLCAFAFATPWAEAWPDLNGIVLSRWIGLATFGLALFRTAILARGRKVCELHYWMAVFAAWSAASILWTLDRDGSAARAATFLQLLVLAWVVWVLASNEARIIGLLQSYVLGTCVCSIGTVANLMAGRTMGQLADPEAAKTDRYTMNGLNPNDLGFMLALSIPIIFFLLARCKGRVVVALACWLQLVLCVITILLSGSRGAALAAAAALPLLPLAIVRLPRWQMALAAAAFAGAIACAANLVPHETWQRFLGLGTEVSEGTMTHRTQIWAASLALFRDHALLGVGAGAHPAAVAEMLGRPLVAHNTFLSVLTELGVIGELLFLGLLGAMFYSTFRMTALHRTFWMLTLAAWCIGACGGTWEYRKATWFLLSLLAAHAYARPEPGQQT